MTTEDFTTLVGSLEDHRREVEIVVDACAYACCGRGWSTREGYEQTYRGYIATLDLPSASEPGGARLIARGIGTVSYFVVFGLDRLLDVRAV